MILINIVPRQCKVQCFITLPTLSLTPLLKVVIKAKLFISLEIDYYGLHISKNILDSPLCTDLKKLF